MEHRLGDTVFHCLIPNDKSESSYLIVSTTALLFQYPNVELRSSYIKLQIQSCAKCYDSEFEFFAILVGLQPI